MKTVKPLFYICSPYRADTEEQRKLNQRKAEAYKRLAEAEFGCRTVAPHTVLPNFLDDEIEEERNIALKIGLDLLDVCDGIVICGDKISVGMQNEIEKAKQLGKRIERLSLENSDRKPYKVFIEETLSRGVIIYAESEEQAHEYAEELCNNGKIDLNGKDFDDRYVSVDGIATFVDEESKEIYFVEDI